MSTTIRPRKTDSRRAASPLYRVRASGSRVGHRITGDRRGHSSSRGVGWEFVHVCIDDASRVAFLQAATAYYASLGITVSRVMTNNGSCYRSGAFARSCRELGLKHIRTRPYTPRTNGKAERFIETRAQGMGLRRSKQAPM